MCCIPNLSLNCSANLVGNIYQFKNDIGRWEERWGIPYNFEFGYLESKGNPNDAIDRFS